MAKQWHFCCDTSLSPASNNIPDSTVCIMCALSLTKGPVFIDHRKGRLSPCGRLPTRRLRDSPSTPVWAR
eukprot:scaffold20531_cov36-Prasinocladus_malaysianus.AAC.1